jgi:hypothetical protein
VVGGVEADVPEPASDHRDVDAGRDQMYPQSRAGSCGSCTRDPKSLASKTLGLKRGSSSIRGELALGNCSSERLSEARLMPGKRSDKASSLRSSTAAKSRRPDLLALFVDDKAYYRL